MKLNRKYLSISVIAIFVFASIFMAANVEALDTVIGQTDISLNGERQHVRTQETNLGNLVTDIIRWNTGADIAVYNGGGIRDSADLGDITLEDAIEILAFDNEVVSLEMTGLNIKRMLEHAVSDYPEVSGKFLQVSGLRFYFDADAEPGNRVKDIYVGGQRLRFRETYEVATNDFLAAGGDEYYMMEESRQLMTFGTRDQAMFIEYIQDNSPLFPVVEGRIVVMD
ncbi:5'-nucleotidase C-terminal domain-containing protein [Halanaerobiaceae bacterium Z-7014]|uniref:5'-nucleotidase C-terminal domain-containing protein n=1 Tax=Halonatronomonas betaini TaxID=2778430 RepID=A0A931AZT0_9FIRM|nr:5'-nucleotidase [Halonatronomonas betaini]MBF8437783.1 5'-nucleotidase C-terminal domain-containing protein [Halonatronomonas betaini]